MKNIRLNKSQQQVAEKYNSFSKTVVVTSFHFVDGKELSTGYCLEDAYQEASLALCIAVAHFNSERGVLFKTYAAAVIRNHLKKVMFSKSVMLILSAIVFTAPSASAFAAPPAYAVAAAGAASSVSGDCQWSFILFFDKRF